MPSGGMSVCFRGTATRPSIYIRRRVSRKYSDNGLVHAVCPAGPAGLNSSAVSRAPSYPVSVSATTAATTTATTTATATATTATTTSITICG